VQSEFLLLNDYDDETCSTSILHPSQLLDTIIDIKQAGSNTRKIYSPNLPDNARVYTYNFDTNQVELDSILAVEHIVGEFDEYQLSSYKTIPVRLTSYDQIKTNASVLTPNPKFTPCNKLGNHSKLLLQVERYNNLADVDDIAMVASDESGEIEIPMTYDIGVLFGYWIGNGTVRKKQGVKHIEIIPANDIDESLILAIIEKWFPDSYLVTNILVLGTKRIIDIEDELLANWLETSHGILQNKQLPSIYYSAPSEYIEGIFRGVILASSRLSVNKYKNVLYCTVASRSELLVSQLIELLSLHLSIPASKSKFKMSGSDKYLYIVNIRVTDTTNELLNLSIDDDMIKFIPKANATHLNQYDDLITIMRPKLELLGKTTETYMFRLKNNNNIIGLNGLIYKSHVGLRL